MVEFGNPVFQSLNVKFERARGRVVRNPQTSDAWAQHYYFHGEASGVMVNPTVFLSSVITLRTSFSYLIWRFHHNETISSALSAYPLAISARRPPP